MIYFDNAATTIQKPQEVISAVVSAMQTFGNSGRGGHESALDASRTIYDCRVRLAKLFHCPRPDHVVFTANSTESLNIAIAGLLRPEDHVISTDCEHNSVLRPLYRHGNVTFIPADACGNISVKSITDAIQPDTRAIVCTHASNMTGNLMPIAAIGKAAKDHGLFFVVDASQTAGVFDIDMENMNIDVLCFTGHKSLMGPQGTGGLCIMPGIEIKPWKVGGTGVQSYLTHQPSQYPTRLEAGTLNGHGIAGLDAALAYIEKIGPANIRRHEQELMTEFYQGIKEVSGVKVYGDFSDGNRAPVVAINIGNNDSAKVSEALFERYGIATRPGAHCAPRLHQALGTQEQGTVRFSFGWYNTRSEVKTAIEAVKELAGC